MLESRTALVVGAAAAALYFLHKAYSAKKPPVVVALPPTMAAVAARDKRCALQPAWPTPTPKAGEVVIRVQATAINRLDCNQRMGKVPVPPGVTEILGLEAAGVIASVGDGDVGGFRPGDEVMALLPGGGYAEYAAVDAATVMRKPEGLSWSAAASIPEAWLTAFKLVHVVGQVAAGDVVLIHAAASGVGIAATQLVVAAGATALVTVGTREKLDMLVREFAAAGGAVRHDGPWLDKITSLLPSGKKGVDVVLDPVASSYAQQNLDALAIDGKWVLYSLMSGPSIGEETSKTFLAQVCVWHARACTPCMYAHVHPADPCMPTSSGKSLVYTLPAVRAVLDEPKARVLLLFPTKALAQVRACAPCTCMRTCIRRRISRPDEGPRAASSMHPVHARPGRPMPARGRHAGAGPARLALGLCPQRVPDAPRRHARRRHARARPPSDRRAHAPHTDEPRPPPRHAAAQPRRVVRGGAASRTRTPWM